MQKKKEKKILSSRSRTIFGQVLHTHSENLIRKRVNLVTKDRNKSSSSLERCCRAPVTSLERSLDLVPSLSEKVSKTVDNAGNDTLLIIIMNVYIWCSEQILYYYTYYGVISVWILHYYMLHAIISEQTLGVKAPTKVAAITTIDIQTIIYL
ncbi:hypothetical protein WN51_04944 [Melipona quadrifasciata]|uniref:Uncharacterized protein n=1 Tax=Melipona quadrifasciata TaxID=166423 RepID=A0A0N0BCZ0_9HYME|nr:hypothetical protein WN51_04944 [Melipona quadrifasciata]